MESQDERQTALSVASRSIATRMGVAETVVDVLRERALRHFAEGLRQYMAIRVGDADRARRLAEAHAHGGKRRWLLARQEAEERKEA